MLIRCLVSSAIMSPRRKEEKFLYYGSVESFLRRGSIEDSADPFFGIMHHNDSENKSREVTTP